MQSPSYIWLADITKISANPLIFKFGTKYKATLQSLLGQEQGGWQGGKRRKSLQGRRSYEFREFRKGHRHSEHLIFFSLQHHPAQLSTGQQCSKDYRS